MKILLGTRNMAKFDFYKRAIEQIGGLTCISLNEISNIRISEVVETGNTAQENASLKARVYSAASGLPTISIDEALYIDALSEQEQPGTHVRRYQSDRPLTDEEMIDRFIRKTHHILPHERTITWLFAICLALPASSDIFMETVQIREMLMDSPKLPLIKGYPLSSLVYNPDFGKPRSEFTDEDITEFNQPICEKLRSLIQKGIK